MARKRNVVIGCHCLQCMGSPRRSWAKERIQNCIQQVRQKTKQLLKKQEYDKAMDVLESTGYLD
jgi:hypothetical protein